MDDQRFYLVLNATFSYIVVKYFIWCWTPLSIISWSNILFGVERHFQLYRGQIFYLVLNATFSYVVVETTDLTQSHWQNYFKDEVSRRTLFDLMHILSWKPIMPIIQRRVWKYQRGNQNQRTTAYTYNKGKHIKVQSMSPTGTKDFTLKYRVWAPQGQHIKVQSMSPTGTKDFTLKYRVWAPHGQMTSH
jgi:hypothetical protein